MRFRISKIRSIMFIAITFVTFFPMVQAPKVEAWYSSYSYDYTDPNMSTHHWLAWEALKLFENQSEIQWIHSHLLDFFLGVDAASHEYTASLYVSSYSDYDDVEDLKLNFDSTGMNIENDSIAVRAEQEYQKFMNEISSDNTNYPLAAFYLGALSHYVGQVGFWGTLWNEDYMGSSNSVRINRFQSRIEAGIHSEFSSTDDYQNNYFSLTPNASVVKGITEAIVDLGLTIFPNVSKFDEYYVDVEVGYWSEGYYQMTEQALTKSVEAIFSVLRNATELSNVPTIIFDEIIIGYSNDTGQFWIDEFYVFLVNDSKTTIVNQSITQKGEFFFLYHEEPTNTKFIKSEDSYNLDFNITTQKWFLPKNVSACIVANTYHSVQCLFKVKNSPEIFSNISKHVFVSYFELKISEIVYNYDAKLYSLDIFDIQVSCLELPELGFINDSVMDQATWHLYMKGVGMTQTGEIVGVPAANTEGTLMKGNLTFNQDKNYTWESLDNDIGLVFTPSGVELYIVLRFTLKLLPVGSLKPFFIAGTYTFIPWVHVYSSRFFRTKDHIITQTPAEIVFDSENLRLDIYNITAHSDYNKSVLDYYEIVEKDVYGEDIRDARWKIFLSEGIASGQTGKLVWNENESFWYAENISLADFPDGEYCIKTKIVNMNAGFSNSVWGPSSATITINREFPDSFRLIPIFFWIGLVVLPLTIVSIKLMGKKK